MEPVMAATMPGAMGPAAMEAALTTEAAVNAGVCARAENAIREKRIGIPSRDVRTVHSISDENIANYPFSVANLRPVQEHDSFQMVGLRE